ncbi:MAG: hypothetical protein LBM95_08455 [Lactobacillales bacterium]|jgi:hypothetical protein|nr:hypothetical protein [Lactobacillales bacterium]
MKSFFDTRTGKQLFVNSKEEFKSKLEYIKKFQTKIRDYEGALNRYDGMRNLPMINGRNIQILSMKFKIEMV